VAGRGAEDVRGHFADDERGTGVGLFHSRRFPNLEKTNEKANIQKLLKR
jgi:hypothetical protein